MSETRYVTAKQLATQIGASIDKVYEMAQTGEIPVAFRVGPRLRFDPDAVVAALQKRQEGE
jgi:excisionase family DNA binding protein